MQATPKDKAIGQQLINLNSLASKSSSSHCGYCNKNGSYSWGLSKQIMHPYTYQLLMEKGWRRCGTYYYKPDIKLSCCKLWTHRMDTNRFRIKKDQRKTVRNVAEWLMEKTGIVNKNMKEENKEQKKPETNKKNVQNIQKNKKMLPEVPQKWQQLVLKSVVHFTKIIQQNKDQFFQFFSKHFLSQSLTHQQFIYDFDKSKIKCFASQPNANSDFYSNYLMLLFGTNKNVLKKQYNCIEFVKDIKQFAQKKLNQWGSENGVCVQVERSGYLLYTQQGSKKMEKRLKNEEHRKQMETKQKNEKKEQKAKEKKQMSFEVPGGKEKNEIEFQFKISSKQIEFGPLKIQIVPAQVTKQSWKMYQRYNSQIHEKSQKSEASYSNFLCQKALKFIEVSTEKPCEKLYTSSWQSQPNQKASSEIKGKRTKYLGSHHMKYYLDKQLIGVGVVDFLPDGLSSVYFFYEPKYKDLRLGVFSSLVQIQYIRWLSLSFPEYKYYYMGFYIQNCEKMSYKGNYQPFELMCPITYQFVECTPQLKQLIQKIENRLVMNVQLANNDHKIDDMNFNMDIGVYITQRVKFKYQGCNLTLKDLNSKIVITVIGILRDMLQIWGKFLFESFTFTF